METILFVTRNTDKFQEAHSILSERGVRVEMLRVPKLEVQSNSVSEVARRAAAILVDEGYSPVLVEDTGLFIYALEGFPGPYSSYVKATIGNNGLLKLMNTVADRAAVFRCAVAFSRTGDQPSIFEGEAQGRIAFSERGIRWGFDPIFEPREGGGLTYAEMTTERKNQISHRRRALEAFLNWYLPTRANEV